MKPRRPQMGICRKCRGVRVLADGLCRDCREPGRPGRHRPYRSAADSERGSVRARGPRVTDAVNPVRARVMAGPLLETKLYVPRGGAGWCRVRG